MEEEHGRGEELLTVPKDVEENLRFRAKLLHEAESDSELRVAVREMARRDRLFFFNALLWTYDPRVAAKKLPFVTYEFQDKFILWDASLPVKQRPDLTIGVDSIVEKSRDMGCTWMLVGNDLHDWLFQPEKIEIRWGSRKEQYVDTRGDMDSIFEKFRYALKNLPEWVLPEGFQFSEHDNTMRLINPQTGSSITGESTNNEFGRGGRKYRIRFDEFAFWDCDENAWGACADATNCRTALSTPEGSSNKFAHLAAETPESIEKFTLHWTLHPLKGRGAYYLNNDGTRIDINSLEKAFELWKSGVEVRSPWYDAENLRRTPREVAQELDIDYLKSGNPFFSLVELSKQKVWEYHELALPGAEIPWGKYIRVNLVDVDNKVQTRQRPDGWLKVYERPNPGGQYVLSADTSEGLPKGDESAGVVRDKWTLNVVAVVNGLIKPEDFAGMLMLMSKWYNTALIVPENNNHGYTVCKEVFDCGGHLYYTKGDGAESTSKTIKRGFTTTRKTRPAMLDQMEEEIRRHAAELRDPDLIQQCHTFVNNEKTHRPEADGDFLDDLVLACAIGSAVIRERPYAPPKTRIAKAKADKMKRRKNAGYSFAGA